MKVLWTYQLLPTYAHFVPNPPPQLSELCKETYFCLIFGCAMTFFFPSSMQNAVITSIFENRNYLLQLLLSCYVVMPLCFYWMDLLTILFFLFLLLTFPNGALLWACLFCAVTEFFYAWSMVAHLKAVTGISFSRANACKVLPAFPFIVDFFFTKLKCIEISLKWAHQHCKKMLWRRVEVAWIE